MPIKNERHDPAKLQLKFPPLKSMGHQNDRLNCAHFFKAKIWAGKKRRGKKKRDPEKCPQNK